MSHIVSFVIDGLVGRTKSLEFNLNRDTNIFFGLNGSGKTSLLKILHSAMSNRTDILSNVPFTSAEVSIYSVNYDKVFKRSITKQQKHSNTERNVTKDLLARVAASRVAASKAAVFPAHAFSDEIVHFYDKSSEGELAWSCSPQTPKEASSSSWFHEYLSTSRLHLDIEPYTTPSKYSASRQQWVTEDQLDAIFARSVEGLWNRFSAKVLGNVRTAQEQGLASILRAVLSTRKSKENQRVSKLTAAMAHARVQNFLNRQGSGTILGSKAEFEKRYMADPMLQDVVQDIDSVEDKIEIAMTPRNKLQELITRMFAGNKEIEFTDQAIEVHTSTGEKIGLASLSSGEKHLLRILVQTVLVRESSMMIDEPELSMHVDWQKDLISSMRALNADAQLIVATHSPEIMANVSDDKIFRI